MVLCSKFSHGSRFLEEKNGLEIHFLVPEMFKGYKRSIFFETPCMKCFSSNPPTQTYSLNNVPQRGLNCMFSLNYHNFLCFLSIGFTFIPRSGHILYCYL